MFPRENRENQDSKNTKIPDSASSLSYPSPTHVNLFARRASASVIPSTIRYNQTDLSTTIMNSQFNHSDNPVGFENPTIERRYLRRGIHNSSSSQSKIENNSSESSGIGEDSYQGHQGVNISSEMGNSDPEIHKRGSFKEKKFLSPSISAEKKKRLRLSFKGLRNPKHTVRSWSENDVPENNPLSQNSNQSHVTLTRHSSNLEFYKDSNHNQSSESNISIPSNPYKELNKSKSFFSFLGSNTNNNNHNRHHFEQSNKNNIFSHRHKKTPTLEVKETHKMYKDYDLATGNKIINKYMLVKELGRGVHGKVKLGQNLESGEWVAIKIVDRVTRRRLGSRNNDLTNEQKIRKEIAILKKCVHPHVVRLKEVIDDPMSRKIYLVIEYMEGGEIQWKDDHDNPIMSIDKAREIFRDVVLGLEYLHHQGIIHRDIKPANLLLTADQVVKISDFGVSHFSQRSMPDKNNPAQDMDLVKTAGSPAFFAPELCLPGDFSKDLKSVTTTSLSSKNNYSSKPLSRSNSRFMPVRTQRPPITKAIDVWALGVTLYCFIFGRCPFIADTEFELFFHVIPHQEPEFPSDRPIDDDLKDLLLKLLEKDPQKRITLELVKKHPWVIVDLPNPQKWREETDPMKYQFLTVTDEEVKSAYTIIDRLKKKIRKISMSLGNMTLDNLRRRSKSVSSTSSPGSTDSSLTHASPISIRRPESQQTLQISHQRPVSLYGSSFPETYARQKQKDFENFVVEETDPSLSSSSSSHSTIAPNSQVWDRQDVYLPRSGSRQLKMKRRSNHSHSSLNQSWVFTPDEGSDNEELMNNKIVEDKIYNNNSLTIQNDQNCKQYVNVVSSDPFGYDGLETISKDNIEIIDTIDSDDDDVGVVFGSNSSRGWNSSQQLRATHNLQNLNISVNQK
ncbi:5300_t:CDS:2 [Diversispora eburnea]|uniref:non-specific serine/threonine protein kinase n=1 Tax=Diversispora eburnea TaxID=1213867 RepID=A0A9N8YML0_9GLOM|nr:5300_t:CDS:2 [Diversispora eburnea]